MNNNELLRIGVDVRVNSTDIALAGVAFFIAIVFGFAIGAVILGKK